MFQWYQNGSDLERKLSKKGTKLNLKKDVPKVPKWFCHQASGTSRQFDFFPDKDGKVDDEEKQSKGDAKKLDVPALALGSSHSLVL